jgi:hypothetical protein
MAVLVASCAGGGGGEAPLGVAVARDAPAGEGWAVITAVDFNADGMADMLWYNATTHAITVWLMDGVEILALGPEIPGLGDGWAAVQAGDTNLDGMADVIWYNATTGRMVVWLMDGTHVLARGPELPGPPGAGWTIPNAVDFNHDGMSDLLFSDPVGHRAAVVLLDGTRLLAPGRIYPGPDASGP